MGAAKQRGTTTFHLMGTCRMAPDSDPTAVVDDQLRVRGLRGLRVVDASIMPTMPSANLNASVLMIAEKAADMIRGKPAAGSDGAEGLNGMATGTEPAVDAVAQLVPATLKALHALEFAGRHLSPTSLPQAHRGHGRPRRRCDRGAVAVARARLAGSAWRRCATAWSRPPKRRPRASPACARAARSAAADRRRLPGAAQLRHRRPRRSIP